MLNIDESMSLNWAELNWVEIVATGTAVLVSASLILFFSYKNNIMDNSDGASIRNAAASHNPQHQQTQQQQQQQQNEEIANLLQYARSSYVSNPNDALSALMGALTLSSGSNMAAQQAMHRIRTELGDVVADRLNYNNNQQQQYHQQQQQQSYYSDDESRQMTIRAMEIVEQLLNDESTFLYAQGRSHILQQAMEDGSSVVCTRCGDCIKAERIEQHVQYWCRSIEEEKSYSDGDEATKMDHD